MEQNNLPLKVMKLLSIPSVHIIRKIFRYLKSIYYVRHLYQIVLFFLSEANVFFTSCYLPITQFIFSTALDGKIKAWLYDNLGSRVDYDAPGHWCTTMAYSADGSRLVSKFIVNIFS